MRPHGDITRALAQAWQQGPAPVTVAAHRSCVGLHAARYTASRMLARGDLVVLHPGRPAVLGLAAAPAPDAGTHSCLRAMQILDAAFWGGRR